MSKELHLYEVTDDHVRIKAPNHISAGLFNGVGGSRGLLITGASSDELFEIGIALIRASGDHLRDRQIGGRS